MNGWALMYHRVVPRRPDTEPYFARGTAIEPDTFARQLDWLLARHAICRPSDDPIDGVVLTFDDGYRDIADHVWPLCRARGVRFAVYPVAGHLADARTALWFDDYYDRLVRCRWRDPSVARRALDAMALADCEAPAILDLRWWVRGPIKNRLHGDREHRDALLVALGEALDAPRDPALPRRLYLDRSELRALRANGVEIGGHGAEHLLHAGLPEPLLEREVEAASVMLDTLAVGPARSYCYPDGSVDDRAAAAIGHRFSRAFTVAPGPLGGEALDPMRLPRYLAGNRRPEDPTWCGATADPDFTRVR